MTISLSVSIMHCNDVAARRVCVADQLRQLQHDPRLAFVEVVKDPLREGVWDTRPTAPDWTKGLEHPIKGTANRPFWRHPDYRGPRP